MTHDEKVALLHLRFPSRDAAEAKARELGPRWFVMRALQPGQFQLAIQF